MQNSFSKGSDDGQFGTEADVALRSAKSDLDSKVSQFKAGIQKFMPHLSSPSGGSCDLPVFRIGTVKGVEINRDLNDWCGELSALSSVIMFIAAIIAFGIVFGG